MMLWKNFCLLVTFINTFNANTCADFQEIYSDYRCVDENSFTIEQKEKYFLMLQDRQQYILRISKIPFFVQFKNYQLNIEKQVNISDRQYTLLEKPSVFVFFHNFQPDSFILEIEFLKNIYYVIKELVDKEYFQTQLVSQNILVNEDTTQVKFISIGNHSTGYTQDSFEYDQNLHFLQFKELYKQFDHNKSSLQANTLQYLKLRTTYQKYMQNLSKETFNSTLVQDLNLLQQKFDSCRKKDPQKVSIQHEEQQKKFELKFLIYTLVILFLVVTILVTIYILRQQDEAKNYELEKFHNQDSVNYDQSMSIHNI